MNIYLIIKGIFFKIMNFSICRKANAPTKVLGPELLQTTQKLKNIIGYKCILFIINCLNRYQENYSTFIPYCGMWVEICQREGVIKTRIVYQVRLNFGTARPYLASLVEGGLLEVLDGPQDIYRITPKGNEALERLREIDALIPTIKTANS